MYGRPGVYVEESLLSSAPTTDPSTSTAVFVAAHGRGPVDPTSVRSWADFTRIYGGFPARTSMLPYTLYNFFNNGGTDAVILRVAGAGAAKAARTFNDRFAGVAGPAPTLDVVADNVGAWGNDVSISILDAGADRFSLHVHHGGTGNLSVVERFLDLSMNPDSERYVEAVINAAMGGSTYITVTDLNSPNSSTGTDYATTRPAVTANPVALAGGLNGDTPTNVDLTNAIPKLATVSARHYLLNFAGVSDDTVINAALTHCKDVGNAFLVVDSPPGLDADGAVAYGNTLQASSYGAVYYPWIHVADPASTGQGATKLVPPGGAVSGLIATTDVSRGVWKAPAGLAARVAGAVGLERALTNADLDTLNSSHVNAVRHISQVGVCVMGARTLKRSDADKFIPIRRTLIHLRSLLLESTRWAAFEPNDSLLWSSLEAHISQLLTGFWQSGGLKGNTAGEAFFVRSDASMNTPDVVAAGEVRVQVGVALRYPAEFIVITLSQWEGGNAAAEADLTTAANV